MTPDWITESIAEGERLDETEYHPRLLRLPKSDLRHTPEPSTVRERKKKDTSHHQKNEELKKKEEPKKKEVEKKSLFDTLQFSDDEEESSKGNSLLDQLKTPQSWKQPSTKPTITTRASASTTFGSPIAHDKPRAPLTAPISITNPPQTVTTRSVTPQPSPAPRAIAQTTAAGLRQVATPPTTELTDPSESDASPSRPISAQGLRAGLQQTAASSGPSSSMGPAQTTNARSSAQLEAPSPANTTSMAQPTQGLSLLSTPNATLIC